MKASKFYSKLLRAIKERTDITVKRHRLRYQNGEYDFLRIASRKIVPEDRLLLIRAGIHGDEIAGPFTILEHINKIIDHIYRNGLKLILYPLANPSGFETGLRYNVDGDKGQFGNNDFLRYKLKSGEIVDDIGDKNDFERWYWSSDKFLGIKLPKETALMHKLLRKEPISQIVAVIDLHQDYLTSDAPAAAYHYSYGNLSVYGGIVKTIENIVPIYKNKLIGAGEASPMLANEQGFIVRHDGTLPDLLYRLGVKYCLTAETTGKTPLEKSILVNLVWIFGVVSIIKNPQ